MKLLAHLFIWTPMCLFASELYLLPQRHHDAVHALCQRVKTAKGRVELYTPSLDRYDLLSCAIDAAKLGTDVIIYSVEISAPLSAALRYDHVTLFRMVPSPDAHAGALTFSLLITPEAACVLSTPLTHDALTQELGVLECDDAPARIQSYRNAAEALKRYAEPYWRQP